jgi:hypothetical protein
MWRVGETEGEGVLEMGQLALSKGPARLGNLPPWTKSRHSK